MLTKGFDFTEEQIDQLDEILRQLYWETEAKSIMLSDITGQIILSFGKTDLNTVSLSALAAGNLAATREMARLIGEPTRFKLLLHEGDTNSVYLSDVGEELLLFAIFGKDTPIGLVRLSTKAAVYKFQRVIDAAFENSSTQAIWSKGKTKSSFSDAMNKSLDNLFGKD